MKKGRFSEEQMVGILREADRSPVAQAAKNGIYCHTIFQENSRCEQRLTELLYIEIFTI
jgi:putative transposase